jgi:hypothetical protein
LSSLTEESLCYHIDKKRLTEFLSLITLITAVTESASGKGEYKKTNKLLKSLRSLYFPEVEEKERNTAERARRILEHEFKKGPLKVRALKYDNSKKTKRRRS